MNVNNERASGRGHAGSSGPLQLEPRGKPSRPPDSYSCHLTPPDDSRPRSLGDRSRTRRSQFDMVRSDGSESRHRTCVCLATFHSSCWQHSQIVTLAFFVDVVTGHMRAWAFVLLCPFQTLLRSHLEWPSRQATQPSWARAREETNASGDE